MTFRLCAALLAGVLLASCQTKPAPAPTTSALSHTNWTAVNINGEDVPTSTTVTLDFGDGKVAGRAGCNSYGGPYEEHGAQLAVHTLISTKMACAAPGVMARETNYLAILGGAASYARDDRGGMVLTAKDGRTIKFMQAGS